MTTTPDYSNQDLRGRDFRGQNLRGARFVGADLRSARFQDADLTGADFSGARLGKTNNDVISSVFLDIGIGLLSLFLYATAGDLLADTDIYERLKMLPEPNAWLLHKEELSDLNIIVVIVIVSTLLFFLRRRGLIGLLAATGSLLAVVVATGIIAIVAKSEAMGWTVAVLSLVVQIVVMVVVGSVVGAVAMAGTRVKFMVVAVVMVAAVFGVDAQDSTVFFMLSLSLYIAWRIQKEDPLFTELQQLGLWFDSLKGTNFRGANLAGARFREANLKHARFVGVKILEHANFQNAKQLKFG